ncbi:MAG TPA: DUF3024 domain-containing protein [Jatrophihabitans sp.]|nr:DUF3024 domain-containing protein [Jatrophihabitans sp.]
MALPELDVARVQHWCVERTPPEFRHQTVVECEVSARHLTIVDRRPPWSEDSGSEWMSMPLARLRYTAADGTWTLYWADRNSRFHLYDLVPPSRRVQDLLDEIERDPTNIFWG